MEARDAGSEFLPYSQIIRLDYNGRWILPQVSQSMDPAGQINKHCAPLLLTAPAPGKLGSSLPLCLLELPMSQIGRDR
jgi:hypothetical protein